MTTSVKLLRTFEAALLLVLCVLLAGKWPQQSQAVASFLAFAATGVLVYITHQYTEATKAYVAANKENADILKSQWDDERKASVYFWTILDQSKADRFDGATAGQNFSVHVFPIRLSLWNASRRSIRITAVWLAENADAKHWQNILPAYLVIKSDDTAEFDLTLPLLKIFSESPNLRLDKIADGKTRNVLFAVDYASVLNKGGREEEFLAIRLVSLNGVYKAEFPPLVE